MQDPLCIMSFDNMELMLTIIIAMPFAGFLILALAGRRMPRRLVAFIGAGFVSFSAVLAIITAIQFLPEARQGGSLSVTLWHWLNIPGFYADIGLKADSLSLVFVFVITFVGALIHIYSVEFMEGEEGFSRFFAYMNLFVGSMLMLVLADNLLLLYLGWEGVGLCSYLLIGFWYKDPANGYAARKAFIVTRVGDTAMIIGLFLLYIHFGTLNIESLMHQASLKWAGGSSLALITAFLLLGGAVGKSAQLPLQTWLPDAMAGPSPVSALIHAATMVTAGVYLIARHHVLFSLAPAAQATVAVIGALTLLIAGFSALTQHDLKRVLAYSTISQIGYMFLALGVGAWSAAIFHFMIHAFFKALLFLAAGSVILLLHEEHDMFRMGGLRKRMPALFIVFLTGAASLSALPLVTAGFYSKDQILWLAWSSGTSGHWLWLAGITGALITSLYSFRMVFITFFGEVRTEPSRQPGKLMMVPMTVLALLSFAGGFIELPENMGHLQLFSDATRHVLPPAVAGDHGAPSETLLQLVSALVSLGGVFLAYLLYARSSLAISSPWLKRVQDFLHRGWGFDWLYDRLFVRPAVWLSEVNRNDVADLWNRSLAAGIVRMNNGLSRLQNGRLRWYLMALVAGAVLVLTFAIYR